MKVKQDTANYAPITIVFDREDELMEFFRMLQYIRNTSITSDYSEEQLKLVEHLAACIGDYL